MGARTEYLVKQEADRIVQFLASNPYGNSTAVTKVVRRILIDTGSYLLARGRRYEIKAKSLGAGVYRVTLEPTDEQN